MSKKIILTFCAACIAVYSIVMLVIFVFYNFNWDKTGVIGDTIGGITSPIVNLFAAFLVYISFEEQRKANVNQEKQVQINIDNSLITHYVQIYSQMKNDISVETISNTLMELEVLTIGISTTISTDNPFRIFLINLVSVKINEIESLNITMNSADQNRFNYLKIAISNGK
ncbi:MAG: hypothetical protein AB7O73_01565 [Bacteroidia bacterium]